MTHELHTPAGDDVPRLRPSAPDPGGLDALFRPDSVAIIGASDDTSKYGNWIAVQAV
ncbi:hypothetical protein, partial [Leucobacter sp. M11]|uniref:hypothetical protein n=1 Tax=Leucobacter sp. M11 TaxID=2993565 RepID=UPI003FA5D989